jgi:VanZ family protein
MFRTMTATAAWGSLAFIAYASLSPLNERPEFDTELFSHLDHYLAFAVAGSLFGLAYPRQTTFVCILVLGSAVLFELLQLLTPDRHARVIDAVRKITGGAFGIAVARLAIAQYRRGVVAGNEPRGRSYRSTCISAIGPDAAPAFQGEELESPADAQADGESKKAKGPEGVDDDSRQV